MENDKNVFFILIINHLIDNKPYILLIYDTLTSNDQLSPDTYNEKLGLAVNF